MKEGIAYLTILLVSSFVFFLLITSWLETGEPAIVFVLIILAVDKIMDKNKWLIEGYLKRYNRDKSVEKGNI
ncbi:short-chain dehydrogenase [Rossellomorea vietnamensis]|uniref:Short-chain dehydrogenase n=1 Tax=Rossellomorea vietnamensis TaxID=218284 RepID=A0A5D4NRG7_9BACI|nr:short-chain dehydrogenase [Rossellomorea vietnamensis]TYS16181.1 short-chain dehydrogenase [Rossellomorea vietnamensis]